MPRARAPARRYGSRLPVAFLGLTALSPLKGVRDTAWTGLFVGVLSGGYVGIDEALSRRYGDRESRHWRHALAGLLAGPALLLATGRGERNTGLATYVLVRALVLLVRVGLKDKHPRAQSALRALGADYEHADTVLMCTTAAHILTSYIVAPTSLGSSYLGFLNTHGGRTRNSMASLKHLMIGNATEAAEAMAASVPECRSELGEAAACALSDLIPTDTVLGPLTKVARCIDPKQNALGYYLRTWRAEYLRALPLYTAVYFTTSAVVQRGRWFKEPLKLLRLNVLGLARSSAFLATYVSNAFVASGLICDAVGAVLPAWAQGRLVRYTLLAAGCGTGGLGVLLEAKSRRMELALFCSGKMVEALSAQVGRSMPALTKQPLFSGRLGKSSDVALFSLATAILFHCYEQERDTFRSKYLSVLDFILGPPTSSGMTPSSSRIFRILEEQGFEYKASPGAWYDGGGGPAGGSVDSGIVPIKEEGSGAQDTPSPAPARQLADAADAAEE